MVRDGFGNAGDEQNAPSVKRESGGKKEFLTGKYSFRTRASVPGCGNLETPILMRAFAFGIMDMLEKSGCFVREEEHDESGALDGEESSGH